MGRKGAWCLKHLIAPSADNLGGGGEPSEAQRGEVLVNNFLVPCAVASSAQLSHLVLWVCFRFARMPLLLHIIPFSVGSREQPNLLKACPPCPALPPSLRTFAARVSTYCIFPARATSFWSLNGDGNSIQVIVNDLEIPPLHSKSDPPQLKIFLELSKLQCLEGWEQLGLPSI